VSNEICQQLKKCERRPTPQVSSVNCCIRVVKPICSRLRNPANRTQNSSDGQIIDVSLFPSPMNLLRILFASLLYKSLFGLVLFLYSEPSFDTASLLRSLSLELLSLSFDYLHSTPGVWGIEDRTNYRTADTPLTKYSTFYIKKSRTLVGTCLSF